MRLKIRKISTAELLVMFFMFVLSGAMYTLPTTSYRVWFGCKCIVLKGSEILRDTVIAAGSIVSGKQTVHS